MVNAVLGFREWSLMGSPLLNETRVRLVP